MMVTMRIPTPLQAFTGKQSEVLLEADTAGEALRNLIAQYPILQGKVLDEQGRLRRFVNLFVGEEDVRSLQGMDTPLPQGAVLSIVPAIAGG